MTVEVQEAMGEDERPLAPLPEGIDLERIRVAVETALRQHDSSRLRIDVILVDDPTLASLHDQFLGDPSVTDVMAFDLRDGESGAETGEVEGEIYVSVDRAKSVMQEGGGDERNRSAVPSSTTRDVASEILLYAVHGALHLCGFDDHEDVDRRAMRRAEIEVFRELCCSLDEAAHLDA